MSIKLLPLAQLGVGEEAIIKKISGGFGLKSKLGVLGFVEGAIVSNLKNDSAGPLVVSLMDTRIALGRSMAQSILVEAKSG